MSKSDKVVVDAYQAAALDLQPCYNFYSGRDTSLYAMTEFEPSLTQQEFADECDVNKIMARYTQTGTVPVYADRQPFYVDATNLPSFMDMQNILISAREAFMALPASVRKEFDNDPMAFAEFANDEKNAGKLKEWKLLSPEAIERLDAAAKAADEAAFAERLAAAGKAAQAGSEQAEKPAK